MPTRYDRYSSAQLRAASRSLPTPRLASRRRHADTYLAMAKYGWRATAALPSKLKLMVIVGCVLLSGLHGLHAKHVAAQAAEVQVTTQQQAQRTQHFQQQVADLLAADPQLTSSVAVAAPGQPVSVVGSNQVFDAASTAKLITAAAYLSRVAEGSASLHQRIAGQPAAYWLRIMIENSDDIAWEHLNSYLTHRSLMSYAAQAGLKQYDASNNTVTAADIATLLQNLYQGDLLPPAQRALLLQYMAAANHRDFIVAAVPASEQVYHKIGMDGDDLHDAAIVSKNNRWLVLVIFTDGHQTYNWSARATMMQSITNAARNAYLLY